MRAVVTGGAGFLGAHVVESFLAKSHQVLAVDLEPDLQRTRLAAFAGHPDFTYVSGDIGVLGSLLDREDELWHLAANTDIPLSAQDRGLDIQASPMLTGQLLEAMVLAGASRIVFPSSGSVYGRLRRLPYTEDMGPLMPCSLYAAGKVAAEAVISAYVDMFGLQAAVFRLGNVVGGKMRRGIVRDFLNRLQLEPRRLTVLGDGGQRKAYVLVDDVVKGMYELSRPTAKRDLTVYNLAAGSSLTVAEVAAEVASVLGIASPAMEVIESSTRSWLGDQPVVELSISYALANGYDPQYSATAAVAEAARRLLSSPHD